MIKKQAKMLSYIDVKNQLHICLTDSEIQQLRAGNQVVVPCSRTNTNHDITLCYGKNEEQLLNDFREKDELDKIKNLYIDP